jgi:hypothetical protein
MASDDVVASSWHGGLLTAMGDFGRNLEQEMVLDVAHRATFTLARHGVCSGTGTWTGCDIWSAGRAIGRARRASERSMEKGWMEKSIFGRHRPRMKYVRDVPRNAGRNGWRLVDGVAAAAAAAAAAKARRLASPDAGSCRARQVCGALVFGSAAR